MKVKFLLCLVLLSVGLLPSASAAIIFADGFNHVSPPGSFITVGNGGSVGPWTVGGGGIDWIGGYWQTAEGNGSIDLSATSAGSVSVTLPTIAGEYYDLMFYLAGNSAGGDVIKDVQVTVGNLNANYSFNTTGYNTFFMGWTQITASFLAAGNDVLTFTSLENNAYGPALDGVTVSSAIPEPASFLLGFAGLAALALFRRKK